MKWSKLEPGFGIIHRSVLRNNKLSRPARLIYALLCSYANEEGEAWPSQERMAEDLGCSEKPIREWIEECMKAGMIEKKLVGFPAHCVYTVLYPVREPTPAQYGSESPELTGSVLPAKKTNEEYQEEDHSLQSPSAPAITTDPKPVKIPKDTAKALKKANESRELTDYYQELFVEDFGAKPTWDGKAMKLVKADLARLGLDLLADLVKSFFEDPGDFVERNGTGLGYPIFHSQIDSLLMRRSRRAG